MSGKKIYQANMSRFFSRKLVKVEKASFKKDEKCQVVINSPFGKRQRSSDDEDSLPPKALKQLKIDGSVSSKSPHTSGTVVSLAAGTAQKLSAFSLCSSEGESRESKLTRRGPNSLQCSPGEDHPVGQDGFAHDDNTTPRPSTVPLTTGNNKRSGLVFSSGHHDSSSNEVAEASPAAGQSSSKLGALKDRFNFHTSGGAVSPQRHDQSVSSNGSGPSRGKFSKTKSQYTPLEQQFMTIKASCSDAVLLVECGYRYRFFGDDAKIAAKELNIYCHLDHNFMTASIPTHRLFVHVRRLVANGYKVGVVKQMETAALKAAGDNKSQPFERKLTALYTKSTLIGEDLDPSSSNQDGNEVEDQTSFSSPTSYLLCLSEFAKEGTKSPKKKDGKEFGMVAVQPATGDIIYDHFHDNEHLSELDLRLHHIQPVELLLAETLSERAEKLLKDFKTSSQNADCIREERLPDEIFLYATAFEEVTSFYTDQAAENSDTPALQSVLNLPKPVIGCLAAVLKYLKEFRLHRILQVTGNLTPFSTCQESMRLDGCALRNLEVFHNQVDGSEKGTLLWVLNHTKTQFGKRQLIKWLSQPLVDVGDIEARLDAVTEIMQSDHRPLRHICELLKRMPDLERGLCSIYHKKCSVLEFVTVTRSLSQLCLASRESEVEGVSSPLLRNMLASLPMLLEGVNSFLDAINKKAIKEGNKTNIFSDPSQFPSIHQCMKDIDEVTQQLADHRKSLWKEISMATTDYVTVSGNEYLVEVKNKLLKTVPRDWIQISSTKQVSRFRPPYVEASFKRLCQLREQLAAECQSAWLQFLESFGERYFSYRTAVQHLAIIDCLVSMATVAKQEGFCRPTVQTSPCVIQIVGGRHPVVSAIKSDGEQYVPNDTAMSVEGVRCMVITGPNMGGKSSYIRQVALICLMAQLGSYVPAESAALPALDAIYTRMGAADDIFMNRSTFMLELLEASDILARATPRSLVIMDELGRGTSTHDGVAIAYATANYLISQVKCLTLFVTHYPPLAVLSRRFPDAVGNFHMSFLLNDEDAESSAERITFLYQLVEGVAARSYGLNVARLAQLPSPILDCAAKKSHELECAVKSTRTIPQKFKMLWETTTTDGLLSQNLRRILDSSAS